MLIGGEHAQANKNTRGYIGEKKLQMIFLLIKIMGYHQ